MKYPLWLPRPKAWGQVITLFLGWIPTITITNWVATPIYDYRGQPIFDNAGGAAIVILAPLTIYFLSLSYQIVWTNDRLRWIPSLRAWLEGLWSFTITVISLLIGYGIGFLIYRDFQYSYKKDDIASIALFLMIIQLAYLFYFRWLLYRLFSKVSSFFQKLTKKKINLADKPEVKVDPIEVELNRIKAEFGLKQMNDVKKD